MPDISGIPGSPEEWMAKAMSDLKLAMISPPEGVQLAAAVVQWASEETGLPLP